MDQWRKKVNYMEQNMWVKIRELGEWWRGGYVASHLNKIKKLEADTKSPFYLNKKSIA